MYRSAFLAMECNDNLTWPGHKYSTVSVESANNLSSGQSRHTQRDQGRSGLPVRMQDGRPRTTMNLRKLFARDGNVHGLIRRTKRPKKGLVNMLVLFYVHLCHSVVNCRCLCARKLCLSIVLGSKTTSRRHPHQIEYLTRSG